MEWGVNALEINTLSTINKQVVSVIRSSFVLENFHIFLLDSENTFNM